MNQQIQDTGAVTIEQMPEKPHEVRTTAAELALIEVLTEISYRKWLVAKATVGAFILGVVVAIVLPVRYSATAKIMTPQMRPSSVTLLNQSANQATGSLASITGGGGLSLRNPNDIYISLLESRTVADALIRRFDLASIYRTPDMSSTRRTLEENTRIKSEKGGLIVITVTDRDKKRCADLANSYTEQLRTLTTILGTTEAAQRRIFFEEQLKHAKDDLVAAEASFQQIQQGRRLVQLDAQAKSLIESQTNIQAQISAKEVQLSALRSFSTKTNPDVQLLARQVAALRAQASELEQHSQASGSTLGLRDLSGAGMEYLRAQHELQYRQALYDLLIKQFDAARLDEAKDGAIVQVVETAIQPDRKSSPKRVELIIIFAICGAVVGFIAVLLAHLLNGLKSRRDLSVPLHNLGVALKARGSRAPLSD